MSNAETKTMPSHRIYSVTNNGDEKSTWTEIGCAFEHRDQRGLSLVFTSRPLEGAQIVLRVPKPKSENASRQTSSRHGSSRPAASEHATQ
jgi:hypothetical protein